MIRSILFSTVLFLFAGGSAQAAAISPGMWSAAPGKAEVSYRIVHKFHEVKGVSKTVDGRAMVTGNQVQVQVRVPAASFTSGNDNRDSNAQAVVDAAKFPYITLKGTGSLCDLKDGQCQFALNVMLDFHGVQKAYTIPVTLKLGTGDHLTATFTMPVVLTQHAIELPSLLFVPIDDEMDVDGVIEMEHKS